MQDSVPIAGEQRFPVTFGSHTVLRTFVIVILDCAVELDDGAMFFPHKVAEICVSCNIDAVLQRRKRQMMSSNCPQNACFAHAFELAVCQCDELAGSGTPGGIGQMRSLGEQFTFNTVLPGRKSR